MDLKVASVIVCLCALCITSTEAGIPKCCVTTNRDISSNMLMKVYKWKVQNGTGACDIDALVLYMKKMLKPICADPKLKEQLFKIRSQMMHHRKQRRFY
ncbi:C-C motif chemokine 25-like [Micropterus dolomieu]|uniref:C-C motif chemokine 25-like n=1 Tax=Micropterus dolomieu TaxID=147949 RepID=UPI001E8DA42D|nr:C-C motif chemokine 25-like [Micropterus dolomieu]